MTLKLFACGDVVNKGGNKNWISHDLREIVQKSDFAICNFEAPTQTSEMLPIKKAGPHVYQSVDSPRLLAEAGFTHVSLANNHIYDFGEKAFKETLSHLTKNKIGFVGAGESFNQAYEPIFIEKNGVRLGILAACENEFGCYYEAELQRSGYAWLFHPLLEDQIRWMKEKVDHLVLIAHAGVENIPIPIKEWRDRYKRLCDLGVNVIIGHHPHVPQGYEYHNASLIFYSIGNFYFDTSNFEEKTDDSYSLFFEFSKDSFNFNIIYHKKINGSTTSVDINDVNFSLKELNRILKDGYDLLNDKYALFTYNSYYKGYYQSAACGANSVKGRLKNYIKKMLGRNPEINYGLLLLHNIRIESHRFSVQRALNLLYEKLD